MLHHFGARVLLTSAATTASASAASAESPRVSSLPLPRMVTPPCPARPQPAAWERFTVSFVGREVPARFPNSRRTFPAVTPMTGVSVSSNAVPCWPNPRRPATPRALRATAGVASSSVPPDGPPDGARGPPCARAASSPRRLPARFRRKSRGKSALVPGTMVGVCVSGVKILPRLLRVARLRVKTPRV